jgi:hypothetical protein
MELELWVANDEPSGQDRRDRILEVDRPYPSLPRQGDIVELGGGVSGQVEKVRFDTEGKATLHFTASRLQSPPGRPWYELLLYEFEELPPPMFGARGVGEVDPRPSPIRLKKREPKESDDFRMPFFGATTPPTEVPEETGREDPEPPPRTTD